MLSKVIEVHTPQELLGALGDAPREGRAIALVGGADLLSEDARAALERFFAVLAEHLELTNTAVVDGGTDSGVMQLIGQERASRDASFRLVGVAPRGALDRTTRDGAEIRLAPGHPEIILVPGSRFGDESEWLFAAADYLAGGSAPTIVINGGKLTHEEATSRLATDHIVVVVAGSGRAADELAGDEGLRASRRLRVVPLTADAATLTAALEA